jgi:hypothetical protein
MSKIHASTQFINVMVKVVAGDEPNTYKVHTAPKTPCVTEPDTVINYQIYDDNHEGIVFTGMIIETLGNDQLSAATVSLSKKQLTFTDANTSKVDISFKLTFKTAAGVEFMHDPQVRNEPR